MCSISLCHLLLLTTTACCHSINAAAHAQQQVNLKGTQQLSVTVRAKKMHFSSSSANVGEKFPSAAVSEHYLSVGNNASYERSKQLNHDNKTKIITTMSEAAPGENYRKSRIIVKETFNEAEPLRLPTGFRPAAAPRYPLLYPFETRLMTRKAQAQTLTEMKEKPIISKEDWTPIAYVLEPIGEITGREKLKISTSVRSTVRPLKDALMEPLHETVIYGAQRRMDEKNSLAVKNTLGHDINFIQAVPRNVKPENNKIYSTEGDGALADLGQQHRYSVRIKQRKGIAAKEKLLRKNQAIEDNKEHSTNKPKENIASNVEVSRLMKPVKNTEMANMNNQSTVTMKISLRRAMKTTNKSDNSSSSASSIAGHNHPIKMSTHQKPFKSNETTWPLNVKAFATSAEEAKLADYSSQTSSAKFSSSSSSLATSSSTTSSPATLSPSSVPTLSSTAEISTSASTSDKAATSLPSTPSASFTSTKAVEASSTSSATSPSSSSAKSSSTSTKFSDSLSIASATSKTMLTMTTMSNNLTTAEPKICVPMLVRENSSENPAEFIDLERIVCFPLPPDSDLNFDEFVEQADEIIELAVKDKSLHEDFWNSRMNSGSSNFNKYLVLLHLILSSWFL